MAVEIDPVWPAPQDCWHRQQRDDLQYIQHRHLMQLTLKISGGEEIPTVNWHYQSRSLNLDVGRHCLSSGLGVALVCKHIGRQYPFAL